jgi:hypothetical protein
MTLRTGATAALFLVLAGCSNLPAVTVIDCAAGDIRHILRIHTDRHTVDDLAFTPPAAGTADVSAGAFILRFRNQPADFQLLFRINRYTGDGTRELIDSEGKSVTGHGGFDQITCKPYRSNPL